MTAVGWKVNVPHMDRVELWAVSGRLVLMVSDDPAQTDMVLIWRKESADAAEDAAVAAMRAAVARGCTMDGDPFEFDLSGGLRAVAGAVEGTWVRLPALYSALRWKMT